MFKIKSARFVSDSAGIYVDFDINRSNTAVMLDVDDDAKATGLGLTDYSLEDLVSFYEDRRIVLNGNGSPLCATLEYEMYARLDAHDFEEALKKAPWVFSDEI